MYELVVLAAWPYASFVLTHLVSSHRVCKCPRRCSYQWMYDWVHSLFACLSWVEANTFNPLGTPLWQVRKSFPLNPAKWDGLNALKCALFSFRNLLKHILLPYRAFCYLNIEYFTNRYGFSTQSQRSSGADWAHRLCQGAVERLLLYEYFLPWASRDLLPLPPCGLISVFTQYCSHASIF